MNAGQLLEHFPKINISQLSFTVSFKASLIVNFLLDTFTPKLFAPAYNFRSFNKCSVRNLQTASPPPELNISNDLMCYRTSCFHKK